MSIPPFFTSYGTLSRAVMTSNIQPICPDVSVGDRLFLFIVNNSNLGETYTFSGDLADDWDECIILNVSTQTPNAYLYTKIADGSESGLSVILSTAPRSGFFHIANFFRFSFVNSDDYSTTITHKFLINLTTCENEPVTTTGNEQLALNFIADRGNDFSFGDFDGETGGNWSEVYWSGNLGAPPAMGLQIATMPVGGTIDDGYKVVGVGRNYRIIGLALKPLLDDSTTIQELSAEICETAWLVLLTIDHPDLSSPLRITTDAVNTISNGNTFLPYPVQIQLPDDIEGRTPQAQLVVDNTTKEIIAALRSLSSPATVTIQIVRSEDTDIVEREWSGLEWRNSTYDASAITGNLTIEDISREEFPYVSFDGRFNGLFP